MERYDGIPITDEEYEDDDPDDEIKFVSETLAGASEEMADRHRFHLEDVAGTHDKWVTRSRHYFGTSIADYKLTLNDEYADPEDGYEQSAFMQHAVTEPSISYVLERKFQQSLMFADLTLAEQQALLLVIETDKHFEDEYQDTESYQAMRAYVDNQPSRPVQCYQRLRTRYVVSQHGSSLQIREERNQIELDEDDISMTANLVKATFAVGATEFAGHDMVAAATIDDPLHAHSTPVYEEASEDDMRTMKEIIYYLGLVNEPAELDEQVIDDDDALFDRLDDALYTDLSPLRSAYIDGCESVLDRMNDIAGTDAWSDMTSLQIAQISDSMPDLLLAVETLNDQFVGELPVPGDMLTINGKQMIQSVDDTTDMPDVQMVHRGIIDGVFDRFDIAPRMADPYLNYDAELMTDNERLELFERFGLGIVLSSAVVTDQHAAMRHYKDEVFIPLQRSGSTVHMFNTPADS
ncbi:MAG: hypothetical protein ABIR91_05655 [Candidatus Saccharimonadales bacterium]